MSGRILLHIVQDSSQREVSSGAIGNVYGVSRGGKRKVANDHRNVVIPAGTTETVTIEVAAGRYVVEAVLPSGEIVSEEVKVKEGQERRVELRPQASPHEWLSWQQLVGNIMPSGPPRTTERSSVSANKLLGGPAGLASWEPALVGALAFDLEPPFQPRVRFFGTVSQEFEGSSTTGAAWSIVDRLGRSESVSHILAADPHQSEGIVLTPKDSDVSRWVYRLGSGGPLSREVDDSGPDDPIPRRYLVVEAPGATTLACLPLPWPRAFEPTKAPVEVLVKLTDEPDDVAVSVSPLDPAMATVLGYMASGSMPAANELFGLAEEMVWGKVEHPLAAAAGGYILLATETGGESKNWHGWIRNLRTWFTWLPDGAIQYGRLKLRHRQSPEAVVEARSAFIEGYRRGLPFYSLGLQWLMDGLTMLGDDPELREMRDHVQAVAARADLGQPFTTLRFEAT